MSVRTFAFATTAPRSMLPMATDAPSWARENRALATDAWAVACISGLEPSALAAAYTPCAAPALAAEKAAAVEGSAPPPSPPESPPSVRKELSK